MEAATPGEGQRDGGRSWTEGSRAGASGEESAAVTCSWAPRGPRFGANGGGERSGGKCGSAVLGHGGSQTFITENGLCLVEAAVGKNDAVTQ